MFILISVLFFGCKTCPPSAVEPKDIAFFFSLVDQEGNDLFFGENSIYNPYDVKFAEGQDEYPQYWFSFHKKEQYFYLSGFYQTGEPYIFYMKFIDNRIDTIKIESRVTGYYEEPKGCRHFETYKEDVFFNNTKICTDCTYEIYKIKLK